MSDGYCDELYEYLTDLWNSAEETGGNSRYYRPFNCWLESCTYKELPDYMKSEYDRGRIIIYPLFPKNKCEDMTRGERMASYKKLHKEKDEKEKALTRLKRWLSDFIYNHS